MERHPKDNAELLWIAEMGISTLYLYRAQRYRGYCILSFSAWDATRLEALSDDEYTRFMGDLRRAAKAIRAAVQPDHMNYELLGNSNPHLHWHIVPRYTNDPRWGRPIWDDVKFNVSDYALTDPEYAELIAGIRAEL